MNVVSMVGPKPEIIRAYLTTLFKVFDSTDIIWAVMRGWERLPEWTRYDVDILVARKDARRSVEVAKKVADETGWKVYGVLKQGMMHSVWMLKEDGESGQSYLRIDIETGNSYRGIEIHESQKCLNKRTQI